MTKRKTKRAYYGEDCSRRWWVLIAANQRRAREFSTNEGGRGSVTVMRRATPEEVAEYTRMMCTPEEVD